MKLKVAFCIYVVLQFSSLRASDEILTLGKEQIAIPIPDGYFKADGEKQVADLTKRFSAGPKANTHLLTLLTPAALQAAHIGKWNGRISYYVQANGQSMGENYFGTNEFDAIKNELRSLSAADIRKEMDTTAQHFKDDNAKDIFAKISAQVGKPILIEEGERYFTFAIPFDTKSKVISSTVLCKGKVLFLYTAENPLEPTGDVNRMRAWVTTVLAANPIESSTQTDRKKLVIWSLTGVVGFGILAILAILLYVWRRNARADAELYKPYERPK